MQFSVLIFCFWMDFSVLIVFLISFIISVWVILNLIRSISINYIFIIFKKYCGYFNASISSCRRKSKSKSKWKFVYPSTKTRTIIYKLYSYTFNSRFYFIFSYPILNNCLKKKKNLANYYYLIYNLLNFIFYAI